jgi:dephospho-CoA kinase
MGRTQVAKLALLGGPGVGKDTFIRCFRELYPHFSSRLIRLADPLYEVQNFIYKICSKEIEKDAQDGVLLNFLGKHMRSINPNVLLQPFAQAVKEIDAGKFVDLILCSDVRPVDAQFVRQLGFTIVRIETDPVIAFERRKLRRDLSLSDNGHVTEDGISANMYDVQISNNGTMQDYKKTINQTLKEFFKASGVFKSLFVE